jgi:hypothetical protein
MLQIGNASMIVAEQAKDLMAPLMPDDLPYEELFGEKIGLESFLPLPVELGEEK